MFKKTKRKIVAAIMTILVLLWAGTLGVIYASSYGEMQKQNERMLQTHAQMYEPAQQTQTLRPLRPVPGGGHGFDPQSPKFQLSTFYTVAVSPEGEILETRNDRPAVYTNEELEAMAKRIVESGKQTGTENNLAFYRLDKGKYTVVSFVDNTVVNESAMTLFRYTLIFGVVALVLFFFLSVFLAGRIVDPLEKNYQKQKQFISDAGHELKTPLSVVSANAELLARELGDNPWLSNIQYENERMAVLVGQLLELARTEDVKPVLEQLELSRLVAGEALPFESVAFEKGLELCCRIDGDITVAGNSAQLKQLVSILLDNAICHSKEPGQIHLMLSKSHGMAVLSVINKGEQIPAAQREMIFERFYRADTARSAEGKHYGLGLAIAKAIVTAHKGHIEVCCREGLVEFRLQIPAL